MNLLALLGNSADTARSISDLAEYLGQPRRAVESALQALSQSVPVVACPKGVYVTEDPDEIDRYADALEGRIASQLVRIRSLRRQALERRQDLTLWRDAA